MFSVFRNTAIGAAALALSTGFALPAQAGYIVTMDQVGPDVITTGSGSLDLAGLLPFGTFVEVPFVDPASSGIVVGTNFPISVGTFTHISAPPSFGGGSFQQANSGTGFLVGFISNGPGGYSLVVESSYVSGTPLIPSTDTWNGFNFASLGVTPGTYKWTWGTGADADSFTLQIGPVATTPEPASLTLLAVGLAGLGMVLRTRRSGSTPGLP
jgi:hypothetical protein